MAGPLGEGPVLAVACDGTEDQAGVGLPEDAPAQAEAVHDTGPVALDDHGRSRCERLEQVPTRLRLQVQGQRPLVPVQGVEDRPLAVDQGRVPAHVVTGSRLLDLDHVGALVREEHGAERSGKQAGEIENADSRQVH